ncbi:MAG: heme o synthase [Alphaproteobacteria bacterium]|jgi:protoheme IX farnesyltransferase|tara:strand:- start:9358 stop:10248 length:891 start_codon:yes stop_codon:yes gene_type:complete
MTDQISTVNDFYSLMKPRVMSLVIFTALVGIVMSPAYIHPFTAFIALLCIATGAGASGVLNMWYDADIDKKMKRTINRPIPLGLIPRSEAFTFGIVMSFGSVFVMGILVNWYAAAFLAITIFFYIVIYTIWLKRRTPQNIVIGGAAGAFPPVIGWLASSGSLSIEPIILFLIIFMWTPAHFWALALDISDDYKKVGIPMMPNTAGSKSTRRQILVYAIITSFVALSPFFVNMASVYYLISILLLDFIFIFLSCKLYYTDTIELQKKLAKKLFIYSIFYLFLIFAILLIEAIVKSLI